MGWLESSPAGAEMGCRPTIKVVSQPLVTIYVVTYQRPHLLIRALRSVIGQSNPNWLARVVNDDPTDDRVSEVLASLGDSRIQLYEPARKRGAAANFNLAFQEISTPFASLLEDDNWWEPDFLSHMLDALSGRPHCEIACGNETIWQEQIDGQWKDTGFTVWPQTEGASEWSTTFVTACGSAKLCNSSLLFRTVNSRFWQTPDDIPVDVTEHFRERCIPQPMLLVHKPLVNYAKTLSTNRSVKGAQWGEYKCLLIGSCFFSLPPSLRRSFAEEAWRGVGTAISPRATTLLLSAIAIPEARALWATSSYKFRFRVFLTIIRRLPGFLHLIRARRRRQEHWKFLCNSTYNRKLAAYRNTSL